MSSLFSPIARALATAVSIALLLPSAHADIFGFGGTGFGWTSNTNEPGNEATFAGDVLTITASGDLGTANSVWFQTAQAGTKDWQATFTYTKTANDADQATSFADGFTFTLQSAGLGALGSGGVNLGYGGVTPSVALAVQTTTSSSILAAAVGVNSGGTLSNLTDVGAASWLKTLDEPAYFTVTYTAATKTLSVSAVSGGSSVFQADTTVDLAAIFGTNPVFVGFTGATGAFSQTTEISDFTFRALAPVATVAVATGDAAYGPTTGNGDTFLRVGVPSINESGAIAFAATIKGDKGLRYAVATTAGFNNARTLPNSATVLALAGDPAPGTMGKFINFRDPLLDDSGMVAFGAWTGHGTAKQDFGVWVTNGQIQTAEVTDQPGLNLTLIALENQDVPGLPGTRINGFVQIAQENTAVVMLVNLRGVKNGRAVLLWSPQTGLLLLLKEGDLVGAKKIKTIRTLGAVAGSAGHGRHFNGAAGAGLLTFTDGTSALARYTSAGVVTVDVASDAPFDFLSASGQVTGAAWQTLSVPCLTSATGFIMPPPIIPDISTLDTLTFRGKLKTGPGGVTTGHTLGVFVHGTATTTQTGITSQGVGSTQNVAVIQAGDAVPLKTRLAGAGYTFKTFRDPVSATQDRGGVLNAAQGTSISSTTWVAGVATIAGQGVKVTDDEVLYLSPAYPNSSYIVTRESNVAPDTAEAKFLRFESVALPAWPLAGPLFVARLTPSRTVNARNDLGLWTADLEGPVRLALREGDAVNVRGETRTVYVLNVLGVVPASSGATRAFNHQRQVAVQVTFTDFTEAILIIDLPSPVRF